MERIAIISDIHGNLEALRTVLDDIKKRNIDRIICLGDILAKGRHFSECIKLVKDNCDVVIQGNCDYYFSSFTKADNEVNDKRLYFTVEFKKIFWTKYQAGISPRAIIKELG